MGWAASRVAFVIEPSPRIGCSRSECALGIPTPSSISCAALSLSSHSHHINAFSSCTQRSANSLCFLEKQMQGNHTVKGREVALFSPHARTHADMHALSSWRAADLATSPNKVILMEEMWRQWKRRKMNLSFPHFNVVNYV